jgi:hypothetical protein
MTEPYDPYDPYRRRQDDPYGQQGQPGQPGKPGQQGQPGQYGQQPGTPYQGGQQYQGQQPYGGQYGQQPGPPYPGGQPDPTLQFDPYGTQQYDPSRGQQPYQGSYGQPAGWAGPGGPGGPGGPTGPGGYPPRPPKKSRAPLIVLAVLAVLLLIGGGVAAAIALRGEDTPSAGPTNTTASGQPTNTSPRTTTTTRPPTTTASDDFEVGQCATLTPQDNNRATIRVAECGGMLSDVVIAKVQSSECAKPYLSFDPGEGKVYCLAMDAKEGDCFKLDNLIKRAIPCTGDETRKVLKIYDGVADDKKCDEVPGTVEVYAYPDPPKTICLGKAEP